MTTTCSRCDGRGVTLARDGEYGRCELCDAFGDVTLPLTEDAAASLRGAEPCALGLCVECREEAIEEARMAVYAEAFAIAGEVRS